MRKHRRNETQLQG